MKTIIIMSRGDSFAVQYPCRAFESWESADTYLKRNYGVSSLSLVDERELEFCSATKRIRYHTPSAECLKFMVLTELLVHPS